MGDKYPQDRLYYFSGLLIMGISYLDFSSNSAAIFAAGLGLVVPPLVRMAQEQYREFFK